MNIDKIIALRDLKLGDETFCLIKFAENKILSLEELNKSFHGKFYFPVYEDSDIKNLDEYFSAPKIIKDYFFIVLIFSKIGKKGKYIRSWGKENREYNLFSPKDFLDKSAGNPWILVAQNNGR